LNILSIEFIVFNIGNYPLSLIELVGTATGLLSVWWAARANIFTWPFGIINIFCFFLLFFQTQLYSDMLLQVFFMITTIYGWKSWAKGAVEHKIEISSIKPKKWTLFILLLLVGTLFLGILMSNIHEMLPQLFPEKAALPYSDAFTAIASVIATFMLAQKKWESWLLWVIVDAISVFVYFYKGLYVVAVEYIIFFGIATYGLFNWYRKKKKGKRNQ
jgi:nicotinamide mononucleotide transporter